MKQNKNARSSKQEPTKPSAGQVDSPPKKKQALPVKPPVSADEDIDAHALDVQICSSHGSPPDGPPPTPVELLAFATAIHGPGPLPEKRKALEQLFGQAFFLWQESQYQIKIYAERLRRLQEEMVPVRTEDDPWSKKFQNLGEFFQYVTGLKRNDDARQAFEKWLASRNLENPEKKIAYFKRTFVDTAGFRPFLEGMKKMFLAWHRRNRGTAGANNVALRECYKFVRKVTEVENQEEVKELFEQWKKHEATTGNPTGEGDALLERLRERFQPWWKAKQAGNANGKDAPKSSRRPDSKKS